MDEWMRSLKNASEAVRPTSGAAERIVERAGRRRHRRRTAVTTLGAAAVVAVIIGTGITLLPRDDEARPSQTPTPTRTVTNAPQVRVASCPTENRIFTEHPAFPHLAEQERVVSFIKMPLWKHFGVRHAAPSALGPVALVTGDLEAARRALGKQGVTIVEKWDPSMAEVGVDADGQISQVVQWQLDPIVQEVRRRIRGVPGYAGIGLWEHNGAILLRWKAPVPDRIGALEGMLFKTRGRVIVEESRYSEADYERAVKAVFASKVGPVHSARFCEEDQAIGLSVEPKVLGDRKAALESALTQIAGMPAVVIAEEQVQLQPAHISNGDPDPPRG